MGNNIMASFLEKDGNIVDKLVKRIGEQANTMAIDEVSTTIVADTLPVASAEKLFYFFDKPGQGGIGAQCPDTFGTSDLAKVRSRNFEEYIGKDLRGLWAFAVNKLNQWDKHLAELKKLAQTQEEKDALDKLLTQNWGGIRSIKSKNHLEAIAFYNSHEKLKYQTPQSVVGYLSGHTSAVTDDFSYINKLSGKNYGFTKRIHKEFTDAMLKFYKGMIVYVEEKVEFQRFNNFFSSREVAAVIAQIPHVKFTACELKALCAQETGDFNDTKIYGVHIKTKGMLRPTGDNPNYVGLGQIGKDAVGDALAWAKGKGLAVNFDKNNRSIEPLDAVVLAACYLGTLTERYLLKMLPEPIPTCTEFKKLVLAAYNSTFNRVVSAAKNYQSKSKAQAYTWELIKSSFPDETQKYVPQIIERLNA
jgi:hypothetical protein